MGTVKRLQLSPAEIVARYLEGESAGMLSLRARVPVYRITEILTAAGIRIRGTGEANRIANARRREMEAA